MELQRPQGFVLYYLLLEYVRCGRSIFEYYARTEVYQVRDIETSLLYHVNFTCSPKSGDYRAAVARILKC